jgi:urease accessory protein
MYDAGFRFEQLERARGEIAVSFEQRGNRTVLADLRQVGSLKLRFPRQETGGWASAVMLNLSGGVAGGDRLATTVSIGAEAKATIATQAAERIYRTRHASEPAQITGEINVARGGACEWLPQETILFNRSALDRQLNIVLAEDAWFLGVEMLVFGRSAMGERLEQAQFADTIRVQRGGRLVLHDAIRFEAAALARPAVAAGMLAAATVLCAAPGAEECLAQLRAVLLTSRTEWGASAWDGIVLARILAPDYMSLRAAVVTGLQVLRGSRPLPRVWLC